MMGYWFIVRSCIIPRFGRIVHLTQKSKQNEEDSVSVMLLEIDYKWKQLYFIHKNWKRIIKQKTAHTKKKRVIIAIFDTY